jgi:hypothetical protein
MNILKRLQLDLLARAEQDSRYEFISCYAVRDLSVRTKIDDALKGTLKKNGKAGLAMSVQMATLTVKKPNPNETLAVGRIRLRHQENVLINASETIGTLIPVEEAALISQDLFHHWSPGYISTLNVAPDAITPSLDFAPLLTYDLVLEFSLSLDRTVKVLTPRISQGGGNITITCGTNDADIYYTSDESLPTPSNGTLYAAAFAAPAAGTVLRACAYYDDLTASNVTQLITT